MKKLFTILVLALAMTLTSCEHFSDGTRSGVVQKFSKRGLFIKTWEGELMMSMPGTVGATAWQFSVEDSVVADSINAHLGERVSVTYHQVYQFKNIGNYRGETDYFILSVTPLDSIKHLGLVREV